MVLGLETEGEVAEAVGKMVGLLGGEGGEGEGAQIDGVLLQQMAPAGTETIIGITRVPRVGPMVMFGLGGIYVEALRDVVLRLCPLENIDADEMIREVKLSALLEGIRGQAPRDRDGIAEVLLRMSQLAMRQPHVAEMDINPLLAMESGVVAVDARIQLSPEIDDTASGG